RSHHVLPHTTPPLLQHTLPHLHLPPFPTRRSSDLEPKTVIRTGYGRAYGVGVFGVSFGHNVTQNVPVLANQSLNPANPWLSVFTLDKGPAALDPSTFLANTPKGPNGFPILPNGIAPNVLP